MIRVKKAPKPTHLQVAWLRRIAQSSMIKTYNEWHQATYSLTTGETVPVKIATALIVNGWVKGQRDGMFDDPQSYVVLKPEVVVRRGDTYSMKNPDSGSSRDNRG